MVLNSPKFGIHTVNSSWAMVNKLLTISRQGHATITSNVVLNSEAMHKSVNYCHVMQYYFTGVGMSSSGPTTYFAWVPAGKDLNQISLYQFLGSLFIMVPMTGGLS